MVSPIPTAAGSNPYLQPQAQAITNQVNQNLQQQILPSINSGAIASGGFGGSRQGIAQANAIGQTNQALGNSLANLYGNAYAQDQQLAAQQNIASMQNQTQRDLGFANVGLGYGNLGLGFQNAANQYGLGMGNLALGNRQADQSYNLGLGNLGLGFQNSANQFNLGQQAQNTNQYQAQTQRDLGFGNLGLGYTQAGQNYQLGMGNLANQQQQTQNQYNLGMGNLGLGYTQANQNYNLGLGGLQNQFQQTANQYNLGLGGLANQAQANQNQYNLGQGNLGLGYYTADQNFFGQQRGQDMQQLQLGANLFNQANQNTAGAGQNLWNMGQGQLNAPMNTLGQYGNLLSLFSGLGGQTVNTQPGGSTLGGALGGAMTAAQLWQLLSGGRG